VIYDVHTHVGCDLGFMLRGWWPYASTAADLLQQMDLNGIDRAVCFPFTLPSAFDPYAFADRGEVKLLGGRTPFDRENALLADEIARLDTDRRLIHFAMFDPGRRVAEQLRNLEKLVGKVRGLKTQSTTLQSNVPALLDESRELMEFAQQHDLPVLFHTAVHPDDTWAQVSDCVLVAEKFPKVRFNLAHSLRMHRGHLEQAAAMPNVWVDCSAHLNHCWLAARASPLIAAKADRIDADFAQPTRVLEAVHELLGGKYMWGSDNPYMSWCSDNLKLVYTYKQEADVFHALPDAVKRSMGEIAPRAWLKD
jgi:predicted TIM-barrel fold metal-dependent hydrolase